MDTSPVASPLAASLSGPEFKKRLQELRQTDNYRNWYYLIRTYAMLVAVIGGAVWFYHQTRAGHLSLLWNVPVFFAAIVITGALQRITWPTTSSSTTRCAIPISRSFKKAAIASRSRSCATNS
jgi:hypothetical protein